MKFVPRIFPLLLVGVSLGFLSFPVAKPSLSTSIEDKYVPTVGEWIELKMNALCIRDDARFSLLKSYGALLLKKDRTIVVSAAYTLGKLTVQDVKELQSTVKRCFEEYKEKQGVSDLKLRLRFLKI